MKKNLQKIKDNNMLAKIFSLIVAILLWSYVMGVENPSESITIRNVRVNFQNVDGLERKGLILLNPTEQFVNIRISGKKNDLDKIRQGSVYATADLEGYGQGDSRVRVETRFESNPGTVQVESVTPRDILVSIDKMITKTMKVSIDTKGRPAENYIVGDVTTSTPEVKLKGPQNLLDKVRGVVTTLDIAGKTEAFTVSNPIKAVDDAGNEIVAVEATPSVIDISVPIFKTVIVPIELKTKGNLPALRKINSYDISPGTITLKVIKDVEIPKVITTEEIDVSNIENNSNIKLKLNIPDGFVPVDDTVSYNLNILLDNYAIRRVEIHKDQIEFRNLPEGLTLDETSVKPIYTVDIKGVEEKVTKVDPTKLKFVCDLGNAHPGNQLYELLLDKNEDGISLNNSVTIELNVKEDRDHESNEDKKDNENSSEEDKQ